jgi:glycerate kinase
MERRNVKVLLAPDSFKGSLSAPDAARAMAEGWRRVFPDTEIISLPIADGGEGTLDALLAATEGMVFPHNVTGPLGEPVAARWGLLGDGRTAVVELAEAAGLTLVPPERRDPKITTTRGVGELLREAAIHTGVRRIIVGLGGSATNDGGAGLLSALGVRFLDGNGNELPPGGAALSRLAAVDTSVLHLDPRSLDILIACDVDNPLAGPRGASAIFGPQKGATPQDVDLLDEALTRFAAVVERESGEASDALRARPSVLKGAGAAGGTAFGLLWMFPKAQLRPGIDLVLDAIGFDRHLSGADLVLTGEGRLDAQTLGGKAVAGVARRAKDVGVPVGALVGAVGADLDMARLSTEMGVDAVLPVVPGPVTLEEAMTKASIYLADAAERAARWMRLGRGD